MSIGARGVVSVVGNIVPKDMIALTSRPSTPATSKKRGAGITSSSRLCRDMLGLSTNPIPIKAAMQMLGRDTGDLRMPLVRLSSAEEAKLHATLVRYGLLKK